jgi:hypothetical protein
MCSSLERSASVGDVAHAPGVMIVRMLFIALLALLGGCDGEAEASAPNPFECIGVSSERCRRLIDDTRSHVRDSLPVRAVIRCTRPICTDRQGEATVHVVFLNGQVVDWVTSWRPAAPVPRAVPPVPASSAPAPASPNGT